MELLKLTYARVEDEFQICTIIGDIYSIYDLYFRLKKTEEVGIIEVFDIGTGAKLDMNKPFPYNQSCCSRLNTVERNY